MYRLLGAVARLGDWGSRNRGHGIPANLVLLAVCIFVFFIGLGNYLESSTNGTQPQPVSQRQLLDGPLPAKDFVELKGTFLNNATLAGETGMVYRPLLEPDSKVVTFIQMQAAQSPPQSGLVRGMLQFVDGPLEAQIPKDQQGLRFNRNQMVSYGARPASPLGALLSMAVSAPLGLLLLVTFLSKYIVFRRHGKPDDGIAGESLETVGVTGLFSLENKGCRRFLDIPANIEREPSGQWQLLARAASGPRVLGVASQEPLEEWSLVIELGSLKSIQAGTLYLGFQQRPALRFTCLEKIQGKRQQIVLSFPNESQRRSAWEELTTCAETP